MAKSSTSSRVDSITITFARRRRRPRPQLGDRKVINGVLHERVWERVHDAQGRPIGYNCTNGRHHYEWVPVDEDGNVRD